MPTFMCKPVHQCVSVIGTKELFTYILIAVRVGALEGYLQGGKCLPRIDPKLFW